MAEPLPVTLGGYAPADSTHGRALDRIADELRVALGDRVTVEVAHNILDNGRPIQGLLADVESGATTLCFFSTSYVADRVPDLAIVDLPYLFAGLEEAHRALDGALGAALSARTRQATGLVPFGYWDNGFRHLSARDHEVRVPEDCRGLRIRLQPNWAHEAYFRALGAEPVGNDLKEGLALLASGALDAQENPLANFVAYGVHELHPHLTLSGHLYGARGVYGSAAQLAGWPEDARAALERAVDLAITQQRAEAAAKEDELRDWLRDRGTQIVTLTPEARAAFAAAAAPVTAEARRRFDAELWDALEAAT